MPPPPTAQVFVYGYVGFIEPRAAPLWVEPTISSQLRGTLYQNEWGGIRNFGMPNLDVEVLSTDGLMLHGHSGAPVVDTKGHLVGIGDGGLVERGAVGVGWSVLAKYLDGLPDSHDSTELTQPPPGTQYATTDPISKGVPPPQARCGFLDFVQTKRRTLEQLYTTSDDRSGLYNLFQGSGIPWDQLRNVSFDVWTDLTTGAGAVLPAGAILKNDGRNCYAETDTRGGRLTFGGQEITGGGSIYDREWEMGAIGIWDGFTCDVLKSLNLNPPDWPNAECRPPASPPARFDNGQIRVPGLSDPAAYLNPDRALFLDLRTARLLTSSGNRWEVFQLVMSIHKGFLGIAFARSCTRSCDAPDTDAERRSRLIGRFAVYLSTFPLRR
jgi:hypothetical protein